MYWFLDFEAYKFEEDFIIKEICILSSDGLQCFNYHVSSPKTYPCLIKYIKTFDYQLKRHKLSWNSGECKFEDVMKEIVEKISDKNTYVKGLEKQRFLEKYLWYVHDLVMLPSFKDMNKCISTWCDVSHGKNCAKRKVHELKCYVIENNINLF